MTIVWQEQREADVPAGDDWLSPRELSRLTGMRFARRRRDWRLGRWTAKCAVANYLDLAIHRGMFRDLEIRSAVSGAPQVFRGDRPVEVGISLSHCEGIAVCAVAPRSTLLGCDLEKVEPHSRAFLEDYFTLEEQAQVAAAPPAVRWRLPVLLWSAKESLLKALGLGLRLDTRCLSVTPDSAFTLACFQWQTLRVCIRNALVYHGWWCARDQFVRTLVAGPPLPAFATACRCGLPA